MPAGGLGPTIDVLFDLLTLSRGKTVANEVLGSGNAAVAGQDFVLQKSPVTYFKDPASLSGDGYSSTVQVWVNQCAGRKCRVFSARRRAAVFVTREDEQGSTHVHSATDQRRPAADRSEQRRRDLSHWQRRRRRPRRER